MTEQKTDEAREREIAQLMEVHPRFSRADAEWCVRLGEAAQRVRELPPEERRRGACLNVRYWALFYTCGALRGTREFLTETHKQDVLEVLESLKQEIDAEFQAFQEEHGVPDVGYPDMPWRETD